MKILSDKGYYKSTQTLMFKKYYFKNKNYGFFLLSKHYVHVILCLVLV